MKIKLFLTLTIVILATIQCFSQFKSDTNFKNEDKNLKHKFYEIVTGNSELNISNLASISTKDSKLELEGNIKISDNIFLNLSANGAINEGISSLLSGLSVTPSLGSELGLHIFVDDNDYYSRIINQYDFKAKQDSLIREREFNAQKFVDLRGVEIKYDRNKPSQTLTNGKGKIIPHFMYMKYLDQQEEIVAEEELKKKLESEVKAHRKSVKDGYILIDKKKITLTKQDIAIINKKIAIKSLKIKKSEDKITQIDEVLKEYLSTSNVLTEYEDYENNYIEEMKKSYNTKAPEEYRINWISAKSNIKNNTIKLHNGSANYEDQISKNSFNNFGFELSYNIYNLTINDHKTYFLRFGVSHSVRDNLDDLSSLKIEEIINISNPDGTSSRSSKKEIVAYNKEEYEENIMSTSIFVDCYWFFSRRNNVALHIEPEGEIEDGSAKFNIGAGLFLSFKTKDKKNPIVNVELYTNLRDVLKDNSGENKLFDRSITNLSLNFPIIFKTNQK